MRRHITSILSVLSLLGALLASMPAHAQMAPVKTGDQVPVEALSSQQREMLALALDLSRQGSAIMERWIAAKEVTEEKLFARLYYPVAKTDPVKFTTEYDRLADRDLQPLGESFLAKSSALVFANFYDLNCYNPTHNSKFNAQPTGNSAVDMVSSRQKWITQNHTGLLSARNKTPFIIQTYQRDTGEILEELAVPIMIHGAHWGAVRVAYRQLLDKAK